MIRDWFWQRERIAWTATAAALWMAASPQEAWAGMPSVSFTDVARLRLESISFFSVGLLLSAGAVWLVWNWLAKDFPRLPRLSYGKACGVVVLWGLLFVVVLTMISGARELMTPGAWERNGWTYKLNEAPGGPSPSPQTVAVSATAEQVDQRRAKIARLGEALIHFAAAHDGRYPSDDEREAIARDLWRLPAPQQLEFVYIAGQSTHPETAVLAYEPTLYGEKCWALFTDGDVRLLPFEQIAIQTRGEAAR